MSAIGDASCPAQRRDARRRVEHLGHARRAARALVADDDDVAVGERVGVVLERVDERALALEHAGTAGEPAVDDAPLDARHLQDRAALGRQVAAAATAGRRSP